jgi:UDP-N-acetylmuramyl pentapeptide phosphotransferase/UDP-N-acetylglucosamine-1-phosphate transferase
MIDALTMVVAFVASGVLAPFVLRFLRQKSMLDIAGSRSAHTQPTPRGGGLGILAVYTPLAAAMLSLHPELQPSAFLHAVLVFAVAVAALGWFDDKLNLHVATRFALQMVCVGGALLFLPPVLPALPLWAEKALLLLAWTWFVNLYNFMDGIDGIAAMQAVFVAITLTFVAESLTPLCLILAGCSLGFLRNNWPTVWSTHKMFLGDVGSTFLGFTLGGLLLAALSIHGTESLPVLLTLPLLFCADATSTLLRRAWQRKKVWQAHREHWYQRAYNLGMGHAQILWRCIGLNLVLFVVAILGMLLKLGWWTPLAGLLVLALAARRVVWLEGKKKK